MPEAIKAHPAFAHWEDNYLYTLMVNLEMDWEEAIAHYLAQGRVCCNPECGKDIESLILRAFHCRIPCRDRAYWLRKKRGDARLRPGKLEEN